MKKTLYFLSTYLFPVVIIGAVVTVCIMFLLENLPYDNSSLDLNMSSEKIVISNNYLMSDTLGMMISEDNNIKNTTGYVEFDIKSRVDGKIKYEIILIKEQSEPEIDLKFVKVYLTDDKDNVLNKHNFNVIPTYYDLRVSETNPSGRVLYSGYLKNKESESFKLRMWTSDTHEIVSENKIFSVKLKVNVK